METRARTEAFKSLVDNGTYQKPSWSENVSCSLHDIGSRLVSSRGRTSVMALLGDLSLIIEYAFR